MSRPEANVQIPMVVVDKKLVPLNKQIDLNRFTAATMFTENEAAYASNVAYLTTELKRLPQNKETVSLIKDLRLTVAYQTGNDTRRQQMDGILKGIQEAAVMSNIKTSKQGRGIGITRSLNEDMFDVIEDKLASSRNMEEFQQNVGILRQSGLHKSIASDEKQLAKYDAYVDTMEKGIAIVDDVMSAYLAACETSEAVQECKTDILSQLSAQNISSEDKRFAPLMETINTRCEARAEALNPDEIQVESSIKPAPSSPPPTSSSSGNVNPTTSVETTKAAKEIVSGVREKSVAEAAVDLANAVGNVFTGWFKK